MTAQTTWPDPDRPGVPMNPERDGWVVLRTDDGRPDRAFWWSATHSFYRSGCHTLSPEDAVSWKRIYGGRLHTPAEVAALVAAGQEAMLRLLDKQWNEDRAATWSSRDYGQGRADGTETAINVLRALDAPAALARIEAAAEARGMERAAEIAVERAERAAKLHDATPESARMAWRWDHVRDEGWQIAAAIRAAAGEIKP